MNMTCHVSSSDEAVEAAMMGLGGPGEAGEDGGIGAGDDPVEILVR